MRPRRALRPRRSRPDTRVQAETPIRTWANWEHVQPGEMQVDTVFHAGGSTGPGHLYTLTVISPYSGWWDAQAIDSLAQRHVIPALDRMRRRAPVRWTALHSDNGSEFLNERAVAWSRTHGIARSRGRPRTSGDQAWVESANRRFVRDLVGDVRYEGERARTALNTLYEVASTLENLYMANRRHVGTTRAGRTVRRLYDEARTPYRRLRESGCLDERAEQALRRRLDELNPAALMRAREALRDEVWELHSRGT